MEAKKKLFEVNIMENKKFVWGLNILAVALIFPFAYIFGKIGSLLLVDGAQNLEMDLLELWLGLLLYFLLIAVHEAIHGIFFKVFCPENPVKFVLNGNRAWPMRPVQAHSTIECKC